MSTTKPNDNVEKWRNRIKVLKEKIIDTDLLINRYEDMKKKLNESRQREEMLQKQQLHMISIHNNTIQQIQILKNENDAWKKREKEFNQTKKEIETLRSQLQHRIVVANNLKNDLDRVKNDLHSERSSNIPLKVKIEELEQIKQELTARIQAAPTDAEILKLKSSIHELETENNKLHAIIKKMKEEKLASPTTSITCIASSPKSLSLAKTTKKRDLTIDKEADKVEPLKKKAKTLIVDIPALSIDHLKEKANIPATPIIDISTLSTEPLEKETKTSDIPPVAALSLTVESIKKKTKTPRTPAAGILSLSAESLKRKAKSPDILSMDFPLLSIKRKAQEKIENYVRRVINTFIDTYFAILENTEDQRQIQKIYRIADQLFADIWSVFDDSFNSAFGNQAGVKIVVNGFCTCIIQDFILKRTDERHIDILMKLIVLFHLQSPANANIFAQIFKILESYIFPGKAKTVSISQEELQAFCLLTSMLSQIDTSRLPPKRVMNKRSLKLNSIAKPFSLIKSIRVLFIDLICSILSNKDQDENLNICQSSVEKFEILFAILAGNSHIIVSSSFVGQTLLAILKQIQLEIFEKSKIEGLVQTEQHLQKIIKWIFNTMEGQIREYKSEESDDYIDIMIEKLLSAIQTLSLTGLQKSNRENITISPIEQDIIESFMLIAFYRNNWKWLYNELYRNDLWPLVKQESAMNIIFSVIGILCSLRMKNVLHWDQQHHTSVGVKDMLDKLLLVIHQEMRETFPLSVQLICVNWLAQILEQAESRELSEEHQTQIRFSIVQWLDRNITLKEKKEVTENFSLVSQLFSMLQQNIRLSPSVAGTSNVSENDAKIRSNGNQSFEDVLDDMFSIKWKK
jgi:hypothetical protein